MVAHQPTGGPDGTVTKVLAVSELGPKRGTTSPYSASMPLRQKTFSAKSMPSIGIGCFMVVYSITEQVVDSQP